MVSYDRKHNKANGEDNRDGHEANFSWNHGTEGPSDDSVIQELRARQQRNMLATLLFSQGTPMLLAGDEVGNSQGGNNNAYCQDNEIGWPASPPDGELGAEQRETLGFLKRLIAFRKEHPVLRRARFLHGKKTSPDGIKDVTWLSPDGDEKSEQDWTNGWARSIGLMLAGDAGADRDARGMSMVDDTLLIMFNAHHESVAFKLPVVGAGDRLAAGGR